jgi:hypothetical protein
MFVKFYTGNVYEKSAENFQICLQSGKDIGNLREDLSIYRTVGSNICGGATMQRTLVCIPGRACNIYYFGNSDIQRQH